MNLRQIVQGARACSLLALVVYLALFGLFCAIATLTGYLKWG